MITQQLVRLFKINLSLPIWSPKRLLDKLLVICPNSEHCDEVLSRCDLESHLAYWCRGTVVPCSNAKAGCQFRAARALQTEHRRECRFQPRTPGTTTSSGGSPVVRPIATKSVVRFGPMPGKFVFPPWTQSWLSSFIHLSQVHASFIEAFAKWLTPNLHSNRFR